MTILRRHLSTGYTVLPTAALEDNRLSFRSRGILAYLLAKPDTWRVRAETIAKAGKEGVEAVRTALRELKDAGYYRVVNERQSDGTLSRITEVYDQAQEWAAEEYRQLEERRLARRRSRQAEQASTRQDEAGAGTETGFSGAGFPETGSPEDGSPGFIGSNQSQYPEERIPPTPAADAARELTAQDEEQQPEAATLVRCPAHPDGPARSCRGCGTSPREQRRARERAEKERVKAAERAASERVLSEVRRQPGMEGLSDVAQRRIREMREARRRNGCGAGEGSLRPEK
ncbi:hypothetical protein ACGFRG_05775 [Streptomyces sp. NPDC048696]|uniref:hypothetical protein n=1 Tax=Streptomyces sp. NPDC048696 TaxID=3365585 RepID=UPI0037133B0D